jgi:hypothetical protein
MKAKRQKSHTFIDNFFLGIGQGFLDETPCLFNLQLPGQTRVYTGHIEYTTSKTDD